MGTDYTRKAIATRLGIQASKIPEEDYLAFIEPYEGMKHLEAVRASLQPSDIVENREVPLIKARLVNFPKDLRVGGENLVGFKCIYHLLRIILTAPAKTFARQQLLKNRRHHILGFLWLIGYYGELREDGNGCLVLSGAKHRSRPQCRWLVIRRNNSLHTAVRQGADLLKEHGVDWMYESQDNGWSLKMSFKKRAGGQASLKALRHYTLELAEKHGEPLYAGNSRLKGEAFALFSKADMRILGE
jgi:hypothetical protein